jgi:hypothetical protein
MGEDTKITPQTLEKFSAMQVEDLCYGETEGAHVE